MPGQWDRSEDDERCIRWTRELYAAMEPHLEPAVYVNSLGADEPERVRTAYGSNYDRLAAIKARYDPDNFFRANQNVAKGSDSSSVETLVESAAAHDEAHNCAVDRTAGLPSIVAAGQHER